MTFWGWGAFLGSTPVIGRDLKLFLLFFCLLYARDEMVKKNEMSYFCHYSRFCVLIIISLSIDCDCSSKGKVWRIGNALVL